MSGGRQNVSGTVNSQSQHASARARRVAYDARRKLAMQTMKAMTKSATTNACVQATSPALALYVAMTACGASINRQARDASAQL